MLRRADRARATTSLALTAGALVLLLSPAGAHKTITSKYTYSEHVFPILRDRCGLCHFEGGPTPMSLLTYRDAMPWAESIREQLTSEAMPPWFVDPLGPSVRGGHSLSARELDVLVTWASGGAPEGDASSAAVLVPPDWRAGQPDLVIELPSVTIPAGRIEETKTFDLPTGVTAARWVRGIDLLPQLRSMVRSATVSVVDGALLGAWVPGHDVSNTPSGTAFSLPAGARLRVSVRYKKHWQDEQQERSDRSRVGVYFVDNPTVPRSIDAITVEHTARLSRPSRVLAVSPLIAKPVDEWTLEAVLPENRRIPLLRLNLPRPGWQRRYWLVDPIELPQGATLEVVTTPAGSSPGHDATAASASVDLVPL